MTLASGLMLAKMIIDLKEGGTLTIELNPRIRFEVDKARAVLIIDGQPEPIEIDKESAAELATAMSAQGVIAEVEFLGSFTLPQPPTEAGE